MQIQNTLRLDLMFITEPSRPYLNRLPAVKAGVRPSMGSVGDCFDNAMCESFFATLECECLSRERFRAQREARMAVFDFIEGFYNPHRRHSALDYESPVSYETKRAESCSMIASAQVSVEAGELLSPRRARHRQA